MSRYTNVGLADMLKTIHIDLLDAGTKLLTAAMARGDDEERAMLTAAGEAVLVAARKARKHLMGFRDDLTD